MTASRIAGSAAAAIFLLLVGACASPQATRQAEQPQQPPEEMVLPEDEMAQPFYDDGRTRVALLAPLSGEHAPVGQALVNAAQMALFDIGEDDFALSVKDTAAGGGPDMAMEEAIKEGAQLVLGPLFASDVRTVQGPAMGAGLPLLVFSNDRTLAGNGVYVMGLTPQAEVERVVDYAQRNGLRRVGLLMPDSAYGDAIRSALRDATQRFGGELVEVVTYDPRSPDFSQPVRQFAQGATSRYDAVLVPAGGRELLSLAAQLANYNVDPSQIQYLGTRLWENRSLGAEPALAGGWFASPARGSWERFAERYREIYDARPPRIASVAYDSTALAAALAQDAAQNGNDRPYDRNSLENPNGFAGVDGLFRLQSNGHVERGLAVYELQRDAFNELEAAPRSFEPLIN